MNMTDIAAVTNEPAATETHQEDLTGEMIETETLFVQEETVESVIEIQTADEEIAAKIDTAMTTDDEEIVETETTDVRLETDHVPEKNANVHQAAVVILSSQLEAAEIV